ncbi:MFS transporter [Flavobacterium sp. SLB02]|uniref:MFS transporter n=1 Tax=Flavobacterium sp. SLB02 TaxID=2665645 RepID=UPI0012AA02AB|nr:MFS transporter [Flavobacterium sp. SLB02]QGK73468.1 MFS transporter [Flavobacterium sp. SLB02]
MTLKVNKAVWAIRSIFFVCGLALSSWAPMVPFAKARLHLDDASLGMLLLLLGTGAIIMMPISGYLSQKFGNRIIITISAVLIAFTLPLLAFFDGIVFMSLSLLLFGAGIGTIDVAMNAFGIHLQNLYGRPIMSSLHGLFSVGGLFGSMGLGILMKIGLSPLVAAICISLLVIVTLSLQYNNLFSASEEFENIPANDSESSAWSWSWLNRSVLFLGFLCFIVFMVEGAMLDWSALFLHENKGLDESLAGVGYAVFSIAMAGMRLFGDGIVEKYNASIVVLAGAILASAGLLLGIFSPLVSISLLGFFLLGCGAANIVPVFFNEAGKLKNVSTAAAVAVITTMGYSGQLLGPAGIGFIAHASSLSKALTVCAFLIFLAAPLYLMNFSSGKKL